jgi:hypothetical protein
MTVEEEQCLFWVLIAIYLSIYCSFTQNVQYPIKNSKTSQAPVTNSYNPSYPPGRDQEDGGSKPAQAKIA